MPFSKENWDEAEREARSEQIAINQEKQEAMGHFIVKKPAMEWIEQRIKVVGLEAQANNYLTNEEFKKTMETLQNFGKAECKWEFDGSSSLNYDDTWCEHVVLTLHPRTDVLLRDTKAFSWEDVKRYMRMANELTEMCNTVTFNDDMTKWELYWD